MASLYEYVTKYGDNTFYETAFNEIDAAVFSALVYLDFTNILKNKKGMSLNYAIEKFFEFKDIKKYSKAGVFNKDIVKLAKKVKDKIRYRNVTLCNYVYEVTCDKQFGAMTAILPDNTKLIIYEGTDHTIVGWEEDFAMFYKYPIPADRDAIKYINKNVSLFDKNVYVMGHSKGGHLAMTAGAFSNFITRMKIKTIYNFDGPGFRLREVNSVKYKKMEKKLEYIIPHYSFFGLLLRHNKKAKVIKSSKRNLMAHSLFSWEVKGTKFVTEPLSTLSKNLSRSIVMWLEMHDDDQREIIVRDVFDYLKKAGIKKIGDITNIRNILTLLKTLDEIDDDTKLVLKHFIKYNVEFHFNNREDDIVIAE